MSSPVVGGGDALKALLPGRVPPGEGVGGWGGMGGFSGGCCAEGDTQCQHYSQLQAEGHPQHLKALHLKVHPDGRLVVLVKGVLAKTVGGGGSRVSWEGGLGGVLPLQPPPPNWHPFRWGYRLMRQVFPTARSPTTMILEILKL